MQVSTDHALAIVRVDGLQGSPSPSPRSLALGPPHLLLLPPPWSGHDCHPAGRQLGLVAPRVCGVAVLCRWKELTWGAVGPLVGVGVGRVSQTPVAHGSGCHRGPLGLSLALLRELKPLRALPWLLAFCGCIFSHLDRPCVRPTWCHLLHLSVITPFLLSVTISDLPYGPWLLEGGLSQWGS